MINNPCTTNESKSPFSLKFKFEKMAFKIHIDSLFFKSESFGQS